MIDSVDSLSGMAGLMLTGGTDVDPALYGQTLGPESEVPDRERDALEQRLLREALEADIPVLAICRGMQLFNVTHPAGRWCRTWMGTSCPATRLIMRRCTRAPDWLKSSAAGVHT